MKYMMQMPYVWHNGEQVHQLDPLALVPDAPKSENMVPLYALLGMTQEAALAISTPWRLKQVRQERDRLIAETDWWVLPDRNPTPEQLAYRQALRDITNNFDPLAEIEFPPKP